MTTLIFLRASCSFRPNILQGTRWKSLICAKNEDRNCRQRSVGPMQSLNLKTLLSILHSSMCTEDKSNDWFLQFEPTKQKSWLTFPQPGGNKKPFYYKVVIEVWRNKGCAHPALMKCGIPSPQSSNEQSLFQVLACRGFLQQCGFPSGVKGLESNQIWTVVVHAWPSQINSDTDSPSGSEPSSTSCSTQQRHTGTKLSPMYKPCSTLLTVNNYWTSYLSKKWVYTQTCVYTQIYLYTYTQRCYT